MKEADIRPRDLHDGYLALVETDAARLLRPAEFLSCPCPACASPEVASSFTKMSLTYRECAHCRSLYVSPRPDLAQVATFYTQGEAVRYWNERFFRDTSDSRRELMFRPRAELAASSAAALGLARPRLMDVGSGFGLFLEEARKVGAFAEEVGIEPSPDLARTCREKGFAVLEQSVEHVEQGQQAGFVTCFEVFEHVHEPLAFLQAIRRLTGPGGGLLLTTLTCSGFDIQVLWERSKSVQAHHLNLLSVEGMRELFARAGWEIVELTTPGRLDLDIVRNTCQQYAIEPPRFVRTLLEGPAEAQAAFQQYLAGHALSSHIRVIARNAATT